VSPSAIVSEATAKLPRPIAITGAVENDVATRTLIVRRPKEIGGSQSLLWREAHQALQRARDRGWQATNLPVWEVNRDLILYCDTPGHSKVVHATPGENLSLLFHFPTGVTAYSELVSKPMWAIVVADADTRRFLSVKFLHKP
jgi:hypothetical protein